MKRRIQAQSKRNAPAVSREETTRAGGEQSALLADPAETTSRWPILAAAGLIVLATSIAYSNSFRCGFVFDDISDIVHNTSIRHLWPLRDVFIVQYDGPPGLHSRPVVNLSLAVNHATGGLEPFQYHVTNLLVHLLAGLTLFGIVRRTLLLPSLDGRFAAAATWMALAVALIWCLHPLATQAVTYITQRYESMMSLFYLLALYAAIRCGTSPHAGRWGAASAVAMLLALGCKEVAVSIPIAILLYDRAFLAGSFREAWRRRWGMYLGLATAWALFAALLLSSSGRAKWAGYGLPVSWFEYALSEFGVILHYLRLAFWPWPLVLDYGWPVARSLGAILLAAAVIVGLVAATAYALIRWPKWGFLGACFFLILAPTSSVVPILDLAVEHRMYLPLAEVVAAVVIGGYIMGQWLVGRGWISRPALQVGGYALLLVIAAALALRTFQRNDDYQSELSIWADVVANAPGNPRGHYNLGLNLARSGQTDKAIDEYREAVRLCPTYADAHTNLGNALVRLNRADEALVNYETVLRLLPGNADAHFNIGNALAGCGRMDEAIAHYEKALEIDPGCAKAHNNLGNVLARFGRLDEAIAHFSKTLELAPGHRWAGSSRDGAMAQREKIVRTLADERESLRARPDDVALLNKIAWTLAANPNASVRNGAEAVELAGRAVRLSGGRDPAILGTLAAAQAEAGRFSEAVDTSNQALALVTGPNDAALADALRARLQLYTNHTAYREMPPRAPRSDHP